MNKFFLRVLCTGTIIFAVLMLIAVCSMGKETDPQPKAEKIIIEKDPDIDELVKDVKWDKDGKVIPAVPAEYRYATKSARDYLEYMPMSKDRLREQLIYDGFSKEAVDYAVQQAYK